MKRNKMAHVASIVFLLDSIGLGVEGTVPVRDLGSCSCEEF